ncbi:MAG TPA: 16S rRNA (guanine(527)-N(7))-methyltransferase RsmG [Candidatus Acidoferrales bacterium]|nr:16S rRNA (guanine(527)-N(7))-methyltransferase RsmG [Candidatus Acidoferrales bacterium]
MTTRRRSSAPREGAPRRGAPRDDDRRFAAPGGRAKREPRALDPAKLLARQPWARLRPLLERCGVDREIALARLERYATLLLEWNRGVSNLISRNDEPRLVERHLAESLQPARELMDAGVESVLDLGSGAGLPAIPLAIAGVGKRWLLVESRRNKTLFMRKAIMELGLTGVEVRLGRLEVLVDGELRDTRLDAFTSRATMLLGPTLELAEKLLKPGGRAFLWKGSGVGEEMARDGSGWQSRWAHESTTTFDNGPNTFATFRLR